MVLVDGAGVPLGVHLSPANINEVALAEATLAAVAVPRHGPGRPKQKPRRVIADRGYDSRGLWQRLRQRGIDLIAPHLRTRQQRFQDGRKLRRYRRRWIIERTNAWLLSFRRLMVRHERRLELYGAFLHLACALIALRQF
jgi:transposase